MNLHLLRTHFPNLTFEENKNLASLTYMKVGGDAAVFVEIFEKDDLFSLCSFCCTQQIPFVILGGASNVVIADTGISALVIKNTTSEFTFFSEGDGMSVTADSGVVTAILAKATMDKGLTGLEHFIGVPGSVGGAVVNNSHFTAHELIGNFVESVEVCTTMGIKEVWPKEKLKFKYDYSIFHEQKDVVLSVTFSLQHGESERIHSNMLEAATKRARTQPIGVPSSGCMFKNVTVSADTLTKLVEKFDIPQGALKDLGNGYINIAAGFLIDNAGLKGTTIGGASVSDCHATYLVNTGTATATDVDQLASLIEEKVFEIYGLKLEREVFFLGGK